MVSLVGSPLLYSKGKRPMSGTADQILAAFHAMQLRDTRQRRLIATQLAALAATDSDFTAEELWHAVQQLEPRLGRATVFRTVERLVHASLLDRVEFGNGTHRYRVCGSQHHHHVTCQYCHRVVEIDKCLPRDVFAAIAAATDFTLDGHSIELFGCCPACRGAAREQR
jgi:Fur family transcriptional regulator, ferric uptake regulator